jgi:hypothetical protein
VTSLGTMFYRLLVASAFVVFLINGVPNNALGELTLIAGVGNVSPPRTMTEPASLLLMGTCLAVIGAKMRRRAKKA